MTQKDEIDYILEDMYNDLNSLKGLERELFKPKHKSNMNYLIIILFIYLFLYLFPSLSYISYEKITI